MRNLIKLTIAALLALPMLANSAPANFEQAKVAVKKYVMFDQNKNGALGSLYCGCDWDWVGKSGGRVDQGSCGYKVRAIPNRAARTEYEHIVPASWLGQQRQCWQNGGRKNCNQTDPIFNQMEANTHNLDIAVGEVNADRSAYRFGMLPSAPLLHGQCDSRVDFKQRVFEPRDEAKGLVSRVMFYMHDRYDLSMSKQQQALYMRWSNQFPPSDWERERDRRNAKIMGHSNPFVTGERKWTLGHRNSGDGLQKVITQQRPTAPQQAPTRKPVQLSHNTIKGDIKGNSNSRIFHLSHCPSYKDVSARNSVYFTSETEASAAGYRKAKNCN